MFSVAVYCGSRNGNDTRFGDAAARLGRTLGTQGCRLVYGGGRAGLMGRLADAVLESGGQVLGVIPRRLMARELGHTGVQELRVVDTMHERKLHMAREADAFIALPGGLGTLEELFEVMTWQQLGYHSRPIGLLDTAGFYAPLRAMLAHIQAAGFVGAAEIGRLRIEDEPERLLQCLRDEAASDGGRVDFTPV
jgi:uncharacterized protein (TIGR00730 family)